MFIFGTIGILVKNIPLPSSVIALCRGIIGSLFLISVTLLNKRKISTAAVKSNLFWLIISGALVAFNWIFLFESYRYTTVSVATLCYYFAPAIVMVVSPIVLKEKLKAKKAVCVFFSLIGMLFVSGVLNSSVPSLSEFKGILFGLAAAAVYASIVLAGQKIRDISSFDKTIFQLSLSAVILLIYCLLTEDFSSVSINQTTIILLLIVGIVHTGLGYLLYFGSMDHIKSQTIAILSYTDPVVALLLSAIILRESMGIFEIIGAILIIGSAVISEFPKKD